MFGIRLCLNRRLLLANMRLAAGPRESGCHDHLSRLYDGIEFDILIRVVRARAGWPEQEGRNAELPLHQPGVARIGSGGDDWRPTHHGGSTPGYAIDPGVVERQFMAFKGRLKKREPLNRIAAEERVRRTECQERFLDRANRRVHVFVRKKLKVDAHGCPCWNAKGNAGIEAIRLHGQHLYWSGIGEVGVGAPGFESGPRLGPSLDPTQKPPEGEGRVHYLRFGEVPLGITRVDD